MLYEYAIEPRALTNWKDFRYVIEQFGISQGRLVSDFPKGWPEKIIKCCNSFSFVQKKIMEIELIRIKKHALIQNGRSYDITMEWLENALAQHNKVKPFRAIIANYAGDSPDYVFEVDALTKSEPLWKVPREERKLRTASVLGDAVFHLLRMSKQIYFVDKMFADQMNSSDEKDRWLTALAHFIKISTDDRESLPIFEYHSEGRILEPAEYRVLEANCKNSVEKLLPAGTSIKLIRWTQWYSGKDFFHSRYILTERGGIRIDWGLDESKCGVKTEQKTDVTLLDDDIWEEYWKLFQKENKTFQRLVPDIDVLGIG